MKIDISETHLFRTAHALQEACANRLADMAVQMAPPIAPEELEAAKALVTASLRLIRALFEANDREFKLDIDVNMTVEYLNSLADA
ncbi:hypothetical protein ABU614_01090 [Lysobacter firmicutimachus]|uniref:Uncharacterized protein n=1 Tax=Lysobacter firmicutimachus TaxID=1792846 RepID=A0AAU8MQL2_9GAMM